MHSNDYRRLYLYFINNKKLPTSTKIKYYILFVYDNMLPFTQFIRKGLVKNNSQ